MIRTLSAGSSIAFRRCRPHGQLFCRAESTGATCKEYVGVSLYKDARIPQRYAARVFLKHTLCFYGVFDSAEQAARARDAVASFLSKSFSNHDLRINLPPPVELAWPGALQSPRELSPKRLRREIRKAVVAAGLIRSKASSKSSPSIAKDVFPGSPSPAASISDEGVGHDDAGDDDGAFGVQRRQEIVKPDGSVVARCQVKIRFEGASVHIGYFDSIPVAAAGYDICARILSMLGHAARRLNFPHDASLDDAAVNALASSSMSLSLDDLRAALGPSSTMPRAKHMTAFRAFLRSIDIPGRVYKRRLSTFRGVSPSRGNSWRARILIGGRIKALGSFRSEKEAARAYDAAARAEHEAKRAAGLRTRKLVVNFPEEAAAA